MPSSGNGNFYQNFYLKLFAFIPVFNENFGFYSNVSFPLTSKLLNDRIREGLRLEGTYRAL